MATTKNQKVLSEKSSKRSRSKKSSVVHYRFLKFRFAHHRHSFKLVHYRHTSYSLLTFIVLISAVLSFGWTALVNGEAYTVHAVVEAKPLTQPAIITGPANNFQSTNQMITVSGSCPAESYIKLQRNAVFSGVTLCQADGSWQLPIALLPGDNLLQAQVYNLTDSPGPASDGIVVNYQPPAVASVIDTVDRMQAMTGSHATVSTAATASAPPLVLSSEYSFVGYYVNQLSNWPLIINGGTAPYAVQFDWGDDTTDLKSVAQAGAFDLQHAYQAPGGYHNSYTIKITVTDAGGQKTLLQLLTIISVAQSGNASNGTAGSDHIGSGATTASSDSGKTPLERFWQYAAPTYAVTLVGLSSFWLGQHRELEMLRQKAIQHHRRRPI